jgi:hypothetical protein
MQSYKILGMTCLRASLGAMVNSRIAGSIGASPERLLNIARRPTPCRQDLVLRLDVHLDLLIGITNVACLSAEMYAKVQTSTNQTQRHTIGRPGGSYQQVEHLDNAVASRRLSMMMFSKCQRAVKILDQASSRVQAC